MIFYYMLATLGGIPMYAELQTSSEIDSADDPRRFDIGVADGAGRLHKIPATAGFSAMELIRAAGLPIKAECGGAGVCATCHCRIVAPRQAELPPPTDEELEKLDSIPTADDRSRLACQIHVTETLAGLILELQPESMTGPFPVALEAAE